MRIRVHILIVLLLAGFWSKAQIYLPNVAYYNNEVERFNLDTSTQHTFFNAHLSLKPLLDKRTNTDSIYASYGKHYYWITQKIFKENFIIFQGDDFWCSIDPVLDLEIGSDLSADSVGRLYWNTRGLRIQGKFDEKVGFTTTIYENQAIVPRYQADFADSHGEFFPNNTNTQYQQNNAVIAGYARTKPFKINGYDFAFAEGNVSYTPNKNLNFQLGNGNHFIGNGYRSLLLSDFTTNYPFAKIETNFWKGRIQYSAIYALHQNLYRLAAYTTPEATYEKKIGTYHYLDIALTKNLQIGLFEGNLWKRVDSLGSHQPDYLFTNPVIFVNTLVNGFEKQGYGAVLGINASFQYRKNRLYGQAVFSGSKLGGYQIGLSCYDLLIKKMDANIEYNHVALNTYLHRDKRYNYSHYNLPLAHPLVNGFDELTAKLSYEHKGFFVQNRVTYSKRIQSDSLAIGNDILAASSPINNAVNQFNFVIYNQLEIGYRFNKRNNLQFFIGHLYRNQTQPGSNPLTNYTYAGIRTRLRNKYLDF